VADLQQIDEEKGECLNSTNEGL